jgi:CheY-like chemotaxis protein
MPVKENPRSAESAFGLSELGRWLRLANSGSNTESKSATLAKRLEGMGIQVRVMKGSRCALACMRISDETFDGLSGPMRIREVVFSTVGSDRIKCLRPRALFQLPILRMLDCRDATALEARIRLAWERHVEELRRTQRWLNELGAQSSAAEDDSVIAVPIAGENPNAKFISVKPGQVILPSPGPLGGVALHRAEDRVLALDPGLGSIVDVEIAISNRLEELARLDQRLAEEQRRSAIQRGLSRDHQIAGGRSHRLLLVGPRLASDRACSESLKLRDYEVFTARSQSAALESFDTCSPELVLVDMNLGRSDGTELIPALRRVCGVEEIPVVLVDEHQRPARRDAAKRVGAAGYLVYPIDVARIAKRLARMVNEPTRRRFTRYPHRLSVRMSGMSSPCLTATLGRGGMFVTTEEDLAAKTLQHCDLFLPELGSSLRVEAEVLYRIGSAGARDRGVGMRFHHFQNSGEPQLIEYLTNLAPPTAAL